MGTARLAPSTHRRRTDQSPILQNQFSKVVLAVPAHRFAIRLEIAQSCNLDASQLEPRGLIAARELPAPAEQIVREQVSHLVARRGQAIDHAVVTGTFANGKNVRVGSLQ
jgi:hypothetical protein